MIKSRALTFDTRCHKHNIVILPFVVLDELYLRVGHFKRQLVIKRLLEVTQHSAVGFHSGPRVQDHQRLRLFDFIKEACEGDRGKGYATCD